MGRPRKFDSSAAINGAMRLFWEKGYSGTNLPDLLQSMGMTRGSFYLAYTDKRSVYILCLEHYFATVIEGQLGHLRTNSGSAIDRITHFLAAGKPQGMPEWGCLICNTAVELATSDPEICDLILKMTSRIKECLSDAIVKDFPSATSDILTVRSEVLCGLYFGANSMRKLGVKISIAENVKSHIESI